MTNPDAPSFHLDVPRRILTSGKLGSSIRRGVSLIAASLVLALTGCQTVVGYAWQTSIKRELPGSITTEHFDVRYHPGSRSAIHARRIGAEAELELAKICARLEVKNDVRYTLFLFDDAEEVGKVAHNSAVGGFSFSRFVCVTVSDDAARFHELIHAVASAKIGQGKGAFVMEGLAGALFEPNQEMDTHAGAKSYRQQGKLPPLAEGLTANATEGWIAWLNRHSDINVYTMAGSWMQFLLEAHGAEKTKRYYRGEDPAAVFGAPLAQLEKDWLSALDRYEVPAAIKARMAYTRGQDPMRFTGVVGETFEGGVPASPFKPPEPSMVFKFQWLKDGKEMAGKNGNSLVLKPLSLADTGIYLLALTLESPDGQVVTGSEMVIAIKVLPRPADFGEKSPP